MYLSNESDIRQKADQTRRERENRGEGCMHSQLQPFGRPARACDAPYLVSIVTELMVLLRFHHTVSEESVLNQLQP